MLFAGHPGFRPPQVHDDVRAFQTLHGAVHQLTHALAVLGIDGLSLRLADFLENHLLGSLRRDPAQHVRRLRDLDFAFERGLQVVLPALLERNFVVRVLHLLDHFLDCEDFDEAGLLVEVRLELLTRLVILPSRRQDGVLHCGNNHLRVNALFAAQLVNRLIEKTRRHVPTPEKLRDSRSVGYPPNFLSGRCVAAAWGPGPRTHNSTNNLALEILDSSSSLSPASPRSSRTRPDSSPAKRPSKTFWFSTGSRSTSRARRPTKCV